jgi:hypothetical protein
LGLKFLNKNILDLFNPKTTKTAVTAIKKKSARTLKQKEIFKNDKKKLPKIGGRFFSPKRSHFKVIIVHRCSTKSKNHPAETIVILSLNLERPHTQPK